MPRYINTDYIIASVLKGVAIRDVVISYDIACKWSIHHLDHFSKTLGAEGVLPSRQIESFLRVFKQFAHTLPSRQVVG